MTIRTGISGWRYPPWRAVFYPAGLPQRRELEFASRRLTSIEINGSFYALQKPENYVAWAAETPDDFVFSIKGPRFVTHLKKLADVRVPVANFVASGVLALGPKLGPVLWQLPPNLGFHPDRLAAVFDLQPRTPPAAARLATEHDERLDDRAWTTTDADRHPHVRELLHVGHEAGALDREHEAVGRLGGPGDVVLRLLEGVEGAVDLDRREVPGRELELTALRQAGGVEHGAPRCIAPAGDPRADGHAPSVSAVRRIVEA